ncbi:L-selectin-like [Myxocyprinus asiaticus]|uniref:L-selectin-like n=1 Tax=Myxocyprinus asiaticus TaxID=70543 RepID=UPI002223877C|nr:L-selectin-like [Myxocyprinus asiaticus]
MQNKIQFLILFVLSPCVCSLPHMFYYVPVPTSWLDAQTYCRQHYTDLATIDDKTDVYELVKTVPKDFKGKYIWIGLYRMSGTSPWIWSDQSKSIFGWWASGQPNNYNGYQFCASIYTDGFWADEDCVLKYTSICYIDRKTQILRVDVKSSQNMNDPEVKKEILKKASS